MSGARFRTARAGGRFTIAAVAALASALVAGALAFAQVAAAATPALPKTNITVDVTDIWWPEDEPGWGVQLIQNADIIFATMFVYDENGEPIFFVATLEKVAGIDAFTGELSVAGGTHYSLPWDPADRIEFVVGTMTFALTGAGTGTLDYSVGPSHVVKTIKRQALKLEDNSGDYRITHTWTSEGAGCTDADAYIPASGPVNGDLAIQRLGPDSALVSLTWRLAPLDVCTTTASYSQQGRLGNYLGTLTCSTSGTTGVLALFEVSNRPKILTGRYVVDWNYGCVRTGQFTAIMPAP